MKGNVGNSVSGEGAGALQYRCSAGLYASGAAVRHADRPGFGHSLPCDGETALCNLRSGNHDKAGDLGEPGYGSVRGSASDGAQESASIAGGGKRKGARHPELG